MIPSFRKLWLAVVTAVFVLAAAGCNDTLRQFIVPIPKPTGDPKNLANAIVLSTNPAPSSNGSTMHIDVSGDTIVGVVPTGPNPVFLGLGSNRTFVINGNNTVTSYITLLPTSSTISTVVLPGSTSGPIGGGTSSGGNFYPANSGSNDVTFISAGVLAAVQAIPTGAQPVAIAGNAANSKIYVVNHGSNDVTVISTTDNTVIKTIPVGSQPIWGVMAANGIQVFIVNQASNSVSVIDTTFDQVFATIPVGNLPNFAFYDTNRQRLYVSNTGSNTVSVIKADGINLGVTPQVLPVLLGTVPVSGAPVSVAALSDGSKAYAALGGCPAGINHTTLPGTLASCTGNKVSVIDANALVEKTTLTLGTGVVAVDTASDGSRAYAVSANDTSTIADNVHNPSCTVAPCTTTGGGCIVLPCLPGPSLPDRVFAAPSVFDIKTSTDTVIPYTTDPSVKGPVPTFFAPAQDPNCTPVIDPNFNKSVPQPCTGQKPFMVRVFP